MTDGRVEPVRATIARAPPVRLHSVAGIVIGAASARAAVAVFAAVSVVLVIWATLSRALRQ
jgi:hypothetical protein